MQHWFNIESEILKTDATLIQHSEWDFENWGRLEGERGGWGVTKLINVWIKVWQRYFVNDCSSFNSFTLYWIDKVTTRVLSFVSVTANFVPAVAEEWLRLISKLIEGNWRVLQILVKYFDNTAVLTSFELPSAGLLLSCYSNLGFE